MSGEPQASHRNQNTSEPTSSSTAKGSCSEYLNGINTRFKNLTDNVLPTSPYLLTVPTEKPFHLGSRFVSNWAVGDNGPFAPEEEHLQYMTFLSHQGEDTLLVAVGGWSDERGNIMEEDTSKVSNALSASATPKNGLQKKKISLSDYKRKATETPKSPLKSSTETDRKRDAPRATLDVKPKVQEPPSTTKKPVPSSNTREAIPTKEDRTDNSSRNARHKPVSQRNSKASPYKPPPDQDSPPPNKKPRLSTTNRSTTDSSTKSKSVPVVVPALLSPTLPPTSIPPPRLPRLLSPTLPPDIEEELAKLTDEFPSNTKKSPSSNPSGSKPERAIPRSSESRPHSSSTSSSGGKSIPVKSKPSSTSKPVGSQATRTSEKSSHGHGSVARAGGTSEAAKPKLIVKLRYGRANRKRIEGLLRFSGKYRTSDNLPAKSKGGLDVSARKREPSSSRTADKHRAEKRSKPVDEDDSHGPPASKRQKPSAISASAERPRTPVTAAFKSPSVQPNPTTSKSQFLTPKKDLKGAAMRRLGSGDSDVKTPTGMDRAMNTSTPGSAEKITKHSPPASTDNAPGRARDTEYRQWRDEFQKYVNLGRELKHTSQRYTGPQATEIDDKLGAAIAIEAVLCFILAFILEDKQKALSRRVGDSTGWQSIVAYWNAVKHITAPYPHLHGLCLLLGAISRNAIHGLDLERLSVIALPSEYSPAPTPGSDGNTVTSEETKKHQKEFLDLRTRLVESYREANRLWLEGTRELSDEVLSRQYPVTWSKRSRNFSQRGREKLQLGEYSGEYFLPLGAPTTPLEAVRFGWSFLSEWTEKEGVRWKGRLGL
ncbi:hypothetical protein FQN53_005182 [Emmonsiellopsis sp. PD_33]|nr:hypothetical protein FQN53_005182 [Emmonsiellopsis sp. PD_33]